MIGWTLSCTDSLHQPLPSSTRQGKKKSHVGLKFFSCRIRIRCSGSGTQGSGSTTEIITDPQHCFSVLRIQDVYPDPESEFFPSRIPHPNFFHSGSRIRFKEFKYFNPKTVSKLSEIWSGLLIPAPDPRIRIRIFYPSRIPDPEVKKAPDPGSGSATLLLFIVISALDCGADDARLLLLAAEAGGGAEGAHLPRLSLRGGGPSASHMWFQVYGTQACSQCCGDRAPDPQGADSPSPLPVAKTGKTIWTRKLSPSSPLG